MYISHGYIPLFFCFISEEFGVMYSLIELKILQPAIIQEDIKNTQTESG